MSDKMENTRRYMQTLACIIDHSLNAPDQPKQVGFVVLTFPFNDPDRTRVNYIGNGNREDIHKSLKELVERWDEHHEGEEG